MVSILIFSTIQDILSHLGIVLWKVRSLRVENGWGFVVLTFVIFEIMKYPDNGEVWGLGKLGVDRFVIRGKFDDGICEMEGV